MVHTHTLSSLTASCQRLLWLKVYEDRCVASTVCVCVCVYVVCVCTCMSVYVHVCECMLYVSVCVCACVHVCVFGKHGVGPIFVLAESGRYLSASTVLYVCNGVKA